MGAGRQNRQIGHIDHYRLLIVELLNCAIVVDGGGIAVTTAAQHRTVLVDLLKSAMRVGVVGAHGRLNAHVAYELIAQLARPVRVAQTRARDVGEVAAHAVLVRALGIGERALAAHAWTIVVHETESALG